MSVTTQPLNVWEQLSVDFTPDDKGSATIFAAVAKTSRGLFATRFDDVSIVPVPH